MIKNTFSLSSSSSSTTTTVAAAEVLLLFVFLVFIDRLFFSLDLGVD